MNDAAVVAVSPGGALRTQALTSLLTPAAADEARAEANRWIKQLRLVAYDGRTMRQRFAYNGESLWWFTEIYLHKMRQLERAVATTLALEQLCLIDRPASVSVRTDDPDVRMAALAFGRARALPVSVEGAPNAKARQERMRGLLVGPSALLSRVRGPWASPAPRHTRLAAFVHTAFWRDTDPAASGGRESYIGPVLDALVGQLSPDDMTFVGLGPRRTFRTRRWWDPVVGGRTGPSVTPVEQLAPRRALTGSLALWREREALASAIVTGPAIRSAGRWREYDLWPVLSDALAQAARVQWPWSARSMDEARAALTALRPDAVVTYAEAGGWGRALMIEARRAGIPSAGLQHGFIYRHWLNYQHEADEMQPDGDDRGFPRPDRTLLFDGYAQRTLETRGHFPPTSLSVTGSPRLDQLVAQFSRSAGNAPAATPPAQSGRDGRRTVVLAAKFIEIERELPSLMQAVAELPDVLCVIKPHPSESPEVYRQAAGSLSRVVVESGSADLGGLLQRADGLITMNSTVAIDCLVLGRPALVVGLPSNLSPFVEAGVMLSASGADIRTGLETLLYDAQARAGLLERGAAFASAHLMRADGRAAHRSADEILSLAGLTPPALRGHEGTES